MDRIPCSVLQPVFTSINGVYRRSLSTTFALICPTQSSLLRFNVHLIGRPQWPNTLSLTSELPKSFPHTPLWLAWRTWRSNIDSVYITGVPKGLCCPYRLITLAGTMPTFDHNRMLSWRHRYLEETNTNRNFSMQKDTSHHAYAYLLCCNYPNNEIY